MRLDEYLVQNGLCPDLKTARGLILKGDVLLRDTPQTKAGFAVSEQLPPGEIRIRTQKPYVSRAAGKLLAAFDSFALSVQDKVVLDCGSSTGGFCEVLLEKGARKIYAVDVGYGLLHPSIRNNKTVETLERTHFLKLTPGQLEPPPDLFTFDLSFISIRPVLLHTRKLNPDASIIALFKPQFEAPRELLKNGIVSDETSRRILLQEFEAFLQEQKFLIMGKQDSPVKGAKGNQETLYYLMSEEHGG